MRRATLPKHQKQFHSIKVKSSKGNKNWVEIVNGMAFQVMLDFTIDQLLRVKPYHAFLNKVKKKERALHIEKQPQR